MPLKRARFGKGLTTTKRPCRTEQFRTQGEATTKSHFFKGHSEVGDGLNMPKLQQLTYTVDTNKI